MKPDLTDLTQKIHDAERTGLHAILTIGLALWHAKKRLATSQKKHLPPPPGADSPDFLATVAVSQNLRVHGFEEYLETIVLPGSTLSMRSLYNYMTAVLNIGLTWESTFDQIAALNLTGVKATRLYKPLPSSSTANTTAKPQKITPLQAATAYYQPLLSGLFDTFGDDETVSLLIELPLTPGDDDGTPSLTVLESELEDSLSKVREAIAKKHDLLTKKKK